MNETIEALTKSIDHYDRMIAYTKKQKPESFIVKEEIDVKLRTTFFKKMKKELGEIHGTNDCELCKMNADKNYFCLSCIYAKYYGICIDPKNENAWNKIGESKSVSEILENLNLVKEQLKFMKEKEITLSIE